MVHLLVTCWTSLGFWGCLVFFCFTLLSTSWDSWHWWKPNTFKDCHLFWLENGAFAIDLLGFLGFWGCLVFCSTLPSSSWDSWYLWNYWYYKHAGKVLGNQSSTIALLYLYVLCGANYLLFQWVHEAVACAALWANSAGVITLASQCHPWQKLDPFLLGPPHWNIAPRLPCLFPTTFGLPYLGHCILLTKFCAPKNLGPPLAQ